MPANIEPNNGEKEQIVRRESVNNPKQEWIAALFDILREESPDGQGQLSLFELPSTEVLLATFTCAASGPASLTNGVLYVCKEHICFASINHTVIKVFAYVDTVAIRRSLSCGGDKAVVIKQSGGKQIAYTSFAGQCDHCYYIARMLWLLRNPDARTKASLSVRFASTRTKQVEDGHHNDTDDDSTPRSINAEYIAERVKPKGVKEGERPATWLWTKMAVPKEKEEVDALREILFQHELPYTVKEAVGRLVLAGGKSCFATELKKQQDVNIVSMSNWGRPYGESSELVRTLTTCPNKGVASEIAESHSLRRCSDDSAVLDIVQEIYGQPYSEYFTLHHQWFFLPYENTEGPSAEDAAGSRRSEKGCVWRVSVEMSFKASSEIQPLIEVPVLNELRKDYTLSVDLALEWMANHQGMDLASRRDCCSCFLAKFLKTQDVDGHRMRRKNSVDLSKKSYHTRN